MPTTFFTIYIFVIVHIYTSFCYFIWINNTIHKIVIQPFPPTLHSPIFKTYSNSLGSLTDQIGFNKRSFAQWGKQIQQSFSTGTTSAQRFGNAFKTALSTPIQSKDYTRNESGEIVTLKNIDSYIPEMDEAAAKTQLSKLQEYDQKVKNGTHSWTTKFSSWKKNKQWLTDFVQNNDLQRASVEDLTKANKAARTAAIAQNEALKAQTLSAKLGQTAMKGLSMSLNMLAFAALSIGIEKFVSWIDDTIHHSERLQEAAAEARSAISEIQSSFQELESSTNGIKGRYAELAQRVDQFSGKNISLTTDDYQEFLDLSNQLSELFPSLTKNYDENGNAILSLTGNVDGIVGSLDRLIEDQETLTNQKIMEKLPESYAGYADNLKNYTAQLEKENAKAISYQAFEDSGYGLSSETDSTYGTPFYKLDLGKNIDKDSVKEASFQLQEALENTGLSVASDFDLDANGVDEEGHRFIRIEAHTEEAIQKLTDFRLIGQQVFGDLKADALQNAKDTRLLLQQETESFFPSIQAMVNSIPQFTGSVSEEQQHIVKQILTQDTSWVSGMWEELGEDADEKELTSWLLEHVLRPIKDNEDLQLQLSSLFQPDSELSPEQMVTLATPLKEQFEENKIPLTLDFILDSNVEGSAANLAQNLNQVASDALNQKYGFNKNTLISTVDSSKKQLYQKDFDSIKAFAEKYSINTQDEIAALQDALEKSNNDINAAFDKYLSKMLNSGKNFEFDPSSFTDSMNVVSSINNLFNHFSASVENGTDFTLQTSDIEELRTALGNTCASFDEFALLATSSSTSAEEMQAALNQLLTEALVTQHTFDGLNSSTRDSIVSQLELQNVSNASEIITDRVAVITGNAAEKQLSLADAASFASYGLLTEHDYADGTASKIYSLAAAEIAYNNTQLDTQGKIDALKKLADAYDDNTSKAIAAHAAEAADEYARTRLRYESGDYDAFYQEGLEKEQARILASIKKYTGNSLDFGTGKKNSASAQANSAPRSGSTPAPTPQIYDWIEHKLSALSSQTNALSKAFERTFTVTSTQKKFGEYLAGIDAELTANRSASAVYQEKLNAVGLSQEWIDKIQNGSLSIEAVSDEALKKQISEYESYYSKQQECEKNLISLAEQKEQAQKTYADKMIAYYEKEISKIERLITLREALVKLKETFGGSASAKDLKYEQNRTAMELSSLKEQNLKLNALQRGVEKGTDAWQTYQDQIDSSKEKTSELTQSIADLAVELANLPLDKLAQFQERNDSKRELYEAKQKNRYTAAAQNKLISKQIDIAEKNNARAQQTAKITAENLTDSKGALKTARTADQKGLSKSDKKQAEDFYQKVQSYTKKGKRIPVSLITALAKAGFEHLAKAAANYNAALAANETAQASAKLSAETSQKEIAALNLQKFQNLQNDYDRKQANISRRADHVSSALELSEAQEHLADQSYYNQLLFIEKENKRSLTRERKRLQKQLNSDIASGKIKKYSEEWYEMTDAIHAADMALAQSKQTLQEYKNQLQQIAFERFNYLQEQISRLTAEADFYIDRMADNPQTDDTGLTPYGIAAMGLHYQNSQTYTSQAAQYAREIDRINQMLSSDPANTALIAQLQEYQYMQRECIENAESEKNALADLVEQGYDALIDSLNTSISKYKEFLQNAKNAHDYQKNISQQTETITTLKKQINAYSAMTDNEEISARLQRLKEELKDAESNLQETMYDKYLSDTQDAMDDMVTDLEDFIEGLAKDRDKLIETGISMVIASSDSITDTLSQISREYNTTLSSAMAETWGNYGNAQGGINAIVDAFHQMMDAADKENDKQAYQTAAAAYTNYRSYEEELEKAKAQQQERKQELEYAKAKRAAAKEEMNNIKKRYGKDSDQYKASRAVWEAAKENYNAVSKKYETSKEHVSEIRNKINAAKDSDKTVVQNFLSSIADSAPTKSEKEMNALDKAVFDITGGYINDYNRQQILDLLGVQEERNAVDILTRLGLLKSESAATDRKPAVTHDKPVTMSSSFPPDTVPAVTHDTPVISDSYTPRINPEDYTLVQDFRIGKTVSGSGTPILPLLDITPAAASYTRSLQTDYTQLAPGRISATEQLSIQVGDLYLPSVTNSKEFADGLVNALKNDLTVQKTLGTFVNTSLTQGNSLSIRKF